jgi:N4-gp56 family major capsid protein
MAKKELLAKGSRDLAYHQAAKVIPYPKGEGKIVRFGRYDAAEVALQALTEGTNPTPQALTISQVTATLAQYGKALQFTDLHLSTIMHDSWQQGMEELGFSMRDSRDYQLQDVLNAETNVLYPGSITARNSLTSTSVPTGKEIRRMVQNVKNPDAKGRAAKRFGNGLYMGVWHTNLVQDLMDDSTWAAQAVRQMQGVQDLKRGVFGVWGGAMHVETNFSPEYQNLGDPGGASAHTDATAVVTGDIYSGGPQTLIGLTFTSGTPTGGALTASTTFDFTVTAIHKHRGFEENISGVIQAATNAGEDGITVTYPDDTDFVYNLYAGASGGTRYLADSYSEGDTTYVVTSIPTSGSTAPTAPAEGVTAYTGHVFGADAFANVEHTIEDVIIVDRADSNNVLNLHSTVGYKYFDANVVLNSNWLYRCEAASAFGS